MTCTDAIDTCSSRSDKARLVNLASKFWGLTSRIWNGTISPMKLISKMLTLLRPDGQSLLSGPRIKPPWLDNWFSTPSLPELARPLPDGKLRLHLFSGDFETEDAAMKYCFHADGDAPEQITLEQPEAFIDTGFVEVVHKKIDARLSEFLDGGEADRMRAKMKGTNTLIIITEDAFGGFPYALVTTKTVYYLGPIVVDV